MIAELNKWASQATGGARNARPNQRLQATGPQPYLKQFVGFAHAGSRLKLKC
jgi:hypothetical protein